MISKILLMLSCACVWLCVPARAQLYLEQAKVNLSVTGGEHANGSILLHNTSSLPMTIRVYWEDFEYKPPYDGNKNFFPAGTTPSSASQWVTFSPQEFTLPPSGQQQIDYTVNVPGTMQEGHYGVLFFERSTPAKLNNEDINLVTRIGSLFFIEPTQKNKKASIENVGLSGHDITANFINQGNIILIPHTTYYIMQGAGLVLLRGEAKTLYVPPGISASFMVHLKQALNPGSYTLVINSDLGDGDVVVKEISIMVDAVGNITIGNV